MIVFVQRFGRQLLGIVAIAVALWLLAFWAPRVANGDDGTTTTTATSTTPVTVTVTTTLFAPTPPPIVLDYRGRTAKAWHDAYTAQQARARALQRTLLHRSSVVEALNLACTVYGHCAELWRKARCESHLRRLAVNGRSGAGGLLQFLASTWATTPFAAFSRFSPYANALAAGWMLTHHRGAEWSCR